jgi:hypothetical protein
MTDLDSKIINTVMLYLVDEALKETRLDAYLYTDLGLENYKPAYERLQLLEATQEAMERSSLIVHQFICPYCSGPLRGIIKLKEKGKI